MLLRPWASGHLSGLVRGDSSSSSKRRCPSINHKLSETKNSQVPCLNIVQGKNGTWCEFCEFSYVKTRNNISLLWWAKGTWILPIRIAVRTNWKNSVKASQVVTVQRQDAGLKIVWALRQTIWKRQKRRLKGDGCIAVTMGCHLLYEPLIFKAAHCFLLMKTFHPLLIYWYLPYLSDPWINPSYPLGQLFLWPFRDSCQQHSANSPCSHFQTSYFFLFSCSSLLTSPLPSLSPPL